MSHGTYDAETGEVFESARQGGRGKLTDEERAKRAGIRAERDALRRAEVATLRATCPACEVEGDAPTVWRPHPRIGSEPTGLLVDLPRVSGRGLPGSRLVIAARHYDGAGPNGGEPSDYATLFVIFRDAQGAPRRSVGTAIRRQELREVARTLLEYAAALDREDAST
jgi:hypothetical protein